MKMIITLTTMHLMSFICNLKGFPKEAVNLLYLFIVLSLFSYLKWMGTELSLATSLHMWEQQQQQQTPSSLQHWFK